MALTQIVNRYLQSIKYSIKQHTFIFYNQINQAYISKYNKPISNNNLNDFIFLLSKKYAFSTVKTIKSLINRALTFAYANKITKAQHCANIMLKQQQKNQVLALNKQEQNKLECYILSKKHLYHYGILIALYTGVRLGELLALKWNNVNFKTKLIYINKTTSEVCFNHKTTLFEDAPKTTSSIREIPISSSLLPILQRLKTNTQCDYVIASNKNKQVHPRAYQKSFENLLNKLHIKHYGFHSLRHTFATRLLEQGVDIKTISELMGHSTPTITLNLYVHTNLQNKRKALEKLNKKSAHPTD